MASNSLFPSNFQKNIYASLQILDVLNKQESKQIIAVLKHTSHISESNLSFYLGWHQSVTHQCLKALDSIQILIIEEEADQPFFSLNLKRLEKISTIVNKLTL